jgi:hypothetical protein
LVADLIVLNGVALGLGPGLDFLTKANGSCRNQAETTNNELSS